MEVVRQVAGRAKVLPQLLFGQINQTLFLVWLVNGTHVFFVGPGLLRVARSLTQRRSYNRLRVFWNTLLIVNLLVWGVSLPRILQSRVARGSSRRRFEGLTAIFITSAA